MYVVSKSRTIGPLKIADVLMFFAQCFPVLYTGDSILLKSGDSFEYWNGPDSIREKVIQCWEVER